MAGSNRVVGITSGFSLLRDGWIPGKVSYIPEQAGSLCQRFYKLGKETKLGLSLAAFIV